MLTRGDRERRVGGGGTNILLCPHREAYKLTIRKMSRSERNKEPQDKLPSHSGNIH